MRRPTLLLRLLAGLLMPLALAFSVTQPILAQDGATDATPPAEETTQTATGTLAIAVYDCAGDAPGTGVLILDPAFAPDPSCTQGTTAISIDNAAPFDVAGYAEVPLPAGLHLVVQATTGAAAEVEVVEGGVTLVSAVTFVAPPEQEDEVVEAAASGSGAVQVVAHLCPPAIQTVDDFNAAGDFTQHLIACPVVTLPDHQGPDGAIDAGTLAFDVTVTDAAAAAQTLASATFVPEQQCEDVFGPIDDDPETNACLDLSRYAFAGVGQGAVSVTTSFTGEGYRLGAAAVAPDSDDAAALTGVDPAQNLVQLDTTADADVTLHLFLFAPPQVSLVFHLCGDAIASEDDLDALDEFAEQLDACPAIAREEHTGPEDAISGERFPVAATVTDAFGVEQTIDQATFVPAQVCEDDLEFDLTDDPEDNACLDISRYVYANVAQGIVTVEQDAPEGQEQLAVRFDPESGDEAALIEVAEDGLITLDTETDGDVTLHIFNVVREDDGEDPDEPQEPVVEVGAIQVIKLRCPGTPERVEMTALDPGQLAGPEHLGGHGCVAVDGRFRIIEYGTVDLKGFSLGDDGMRVLLKVAATSADTGQHILTDLDSDEEVAFEVAPGTMTRIIVREYLAPDAPVTNPSTGNGDDTEDPLDPIDPVTTPETGTPDPIDELNGGVVIPVVDLSVFGTEDPETLGDPAVTDPAQVVENLPVTGAGSTPRAGAGVLAGAALLLVALAGGVLTRRRVTTG